MGKERPLEVLQEAGADGDGGDGAWWWHHNCFVPTEGMGHFQLLHAQVKLGGEGRKDLSK